MNRLKIIFIPTLMTTLFSCSPILSKRTDVQAWNEYHHEQKMKRSPAQALKIASAALPEVVEAKKQLEVLLDAAPVRAFLMACAGVEACYQSKLTLYFDQSYQKAQQRIPASVPEKLWTENYKNAQKEFFADQSFPRIVEEVHSFHQLLLSGLELRASDRIHDLNTQCETAKEGENTLEFTNFLGGVTYIPKNIYGCLNAHWQSDAEQLFGETTDRLGVTFVGTADNTADDAKNWVVQREIFPTYAQETKNILQKKQDAELAQWPSEVSQLSKNAIHDSQCVAKSVKQWSPILREKYHYLNLEALLTQVFTQSCKG
jgi:hypothetical protein